MIDCGRCRMRGNGCRDCVVPVLQPPIVPAFLGQAEVRALGVLADAGLVPPLRLDPAGAGAPSVQRRTRHVIPEAKDGAAA
jgi:hypothetical protein